MGFCIHFESYGRYVPSAKRRDSDVVLAVGGWALI
jgi:hypothetical protein